MTGSHPLITALNREWRRLGEQDAIPLRSWAAVHPALAGCTEPDDVLTAIRRDPDPVLGVLLTLGSAGSEHAHRIVLQAMLGKAVLLARRDPTHDLGDYLAELWLLIRGYPLQRRPRQIAANLALDCRKRVRARDRAVPRDPGEFADLRARESGEDPSALRVLAEAERLGLIDRTTGRTLRAVYCEGQPSAQFAAESGTSAATVRWRCSRALRRLATHAETLACA